jgi:hypothetical protein
MAERTPEQIARNEAIRAALDAVLPTCSADLVQMCEGIEHTGKSLAELLGAGAEQILEDDDDIMGPKELASALLLWARLRLCRQQTRKQLSERAMAVGAVARKLKQTMATAKPMAWKSTAPQAMLLYRYDDGRVSTRLYFRLRGIVWADGPLEERLFDKAFRNQLMQALPDGPSAEIVPEIGSLVADILKARRKRNPPGSPDAVPIALPPAPPMLKALRGGTRNSSEGCTGVHARDFGVRSLEFASNMREKFRSVVLELGAAGGGAIVEKPIGACDVWEGVRWSKCAEVGAPLQQAWGLAIAERLFSLWKSIGLAEDGTVKPYPSPEARARQGLPGPPRLPGCWCPHRPRAPCRSPTRMKMRDFLGLLCETKRTLMGELLSGYQHVTGSTDPSLLQQHALHVLNALRYEKRANVRWEQLLHWQLAPEPEPAEAEAIEGQFPAIANELRGAQAKLEALEKLLIEGLAEYADARGALRMHCFNREAEIPLSTQLAIRLAGTPLGEQLNQRFEQLEAKELEPKYLGAGHIFTEGAEGAEALAAAEAQYRQWLAYPCGDAGDAGDAAVEEAAPEEYLIPASDASDELAVDNVELASFIGCLPAMVRNATGVSSGAVVGDHAAYDLFLSEKLKRLMEDPTTLQMLTIGSAARYTWAAWRKAGSPSGPKGKEPVLGVSPPPSNTPKPKPPQLSFDKLCELAKLLGPIDGRVRGAIPKGATPLEGLAAVKEEIAALEADATVLKNPNDIDIDQIRDCLNALLDLVGAATYEMRTKKVGVWADPPVSSSSDVVGALPEPPPDAPAEDVAALVPAIDAAAADPLFSPRMAGMTAEQLAEEKMVKSRNSRSVKKLRDYISEALSQAFDMFTASKLDAASILSVAAEAVGDVSVEQADLIRSIYKVMYKSNECGCTFDMVLLQQKVPNAAPRRFLSKLVKRKPCIKVSADEARAWCGDLDGEGEAAAAKAWAKAVQKAIDASRAAQASLLHWITYLTVEDLQAIQGELSTPPPGGSAILLNDMVASGIGGVAKNSLLQKLDTALVPDMDEPMRLPKTYRLLTGREAQGGASEAAYGLPLRYAEGEEDKKTKDPNALQEIVMMSAGAWDDSESVPRWTNFRSWDYTTTMRTQSGMPAVAAAGLGLLDAGQRLRPDGSQMNVLRLHRIWTMQNSAADKASCLTMERMLDEFVTLTVRSAFFETVAGIVDQFELKGRSDVFQQLIGVKGFGELKARGPEGKKAIEGLQYVQPAMLTDDGQTRVVFGAGTRETCGSLSEHFRMGEQITWSPWGTILSILRVEKPLDTHFEFLAFFNVNNYAAVKKMLASTVVYYELFNQSAPEGKQSKRFLARKYVGSAAVFGRLEAEMGRQSGNISTVSAPLAGEALSDLRKRKKHMSDPSVEDAELPQLLLNGEKGVPGEQIDLAREAHKLCLDGPEGGAAPEGAPKLSTVHYGGRWLPLGEGSNRKGELVLCVRETIGWKYNSIASRSIGFLCREIFCDKSMKEPQPRAPGFMAAWKLHIERGGK